MSIRPDDAVSQWVRLANVRSIVLTALMTAALAPSGGLVHDNERLRDLSLTMSILYVILHVAVRLCVRRLSAAQDTTTLRTVEYLRDPRRITSLDLAAYWAAFAVIGPMFWLRA